MMRPRQPRVSRRGCWGSAALAAAATVLALSGCTGRPAPHVETNPPAADAATLSPHDAIAKIMAAAPQDRATLGIATGTLSGPTGTVSVVARMLQVQSRATSTVVVWRLSSASGQPVDTKSFQLAAPPRTDTRLLGLVDTATNTTYRPYTFIPAQGNGTDLECACSRLPNSVDKTGEVMYAVLPPLPASVTKVDITMPGFETMTNVPVHRST